MTRRSPLPRPYDSAVFRRRDALAAGIGRGRLAGRDLDVPFRGVRIPATAAADLVARCRAALLVLAPGVAFTAATAAMLYGAPLPRALELGALYVAVRTGTGAGPRRRGLVTRRHGSFTVRHRDGIPVTTPERT